MNQLNKTEAVPALTDDTNKTSAQVPNMQLAQALTMFEQWRASKKKPSESIPDALWLELFALEKHFSRSKLRAFFNISSTQYKSKKAKHAENTKPSSPPEPTTLATPTVLCEVTLQPSKKDSALKRQLYAHEPLPSATTVIVEFCREDGRIMKIHTTQDNLTELMQRFLGGAS